MDKLSKGKILIFKNREEKIVKASNNRLTGEVVTEKQVYSTDFIYRWLEFGFVTIKQSK